MYKTNKKGLAIDFLFIETAGRMEGPRLEVPPINVRLVCSSETGWMRVWPSPPAGNAENSAGDVADLTFFPISLLLR
jgi:hypothetical protein